MPFELPPLPYAYDALEPTIDDETMHLHHDSDEVAYVLSGEITFKIGDRITVGGPGTSAFMPRDIPHAWGHPLAPLTQTERENKFRLCWRLTRPSSDARMEQAIAWLKRLPQQLDVGELVRLLAG